MIRAGDRITIKPEWQDVGDSDYQWYALEDEDGGRVLIGVENGMAVCPQYRIETAMLMEA